MFDFDLGEKRHIPEPDLVPILDALTSVIFFLLLSASFLSLTKLTVPPAQLSAITDQREIVPLNPKLLGYEKNGNLILKLEWQGEKPSSLEKMVPRMMPRNLDLITVATNLFEEFAAKFPNESVVQVSLSDSMQYQELISIMDGARKRMKDVVLLSPSDANIVAGVGR